MALLSALLKDADKRDLTRLDEYRAVGGYKALEKARKMTSCCRFKASSPSMSALTNPNLEFRTSSTLTCT